MAGAKRLLKERVVYAVNCGSKTSYKSSDGFVYRADSGFSEGTEVSQWGEEVSMANQRIKYTDDRDIFMTERWARQDFSYDIPLAEDGQYVLITQNSENAFDTGGNRVWDVYIGRQLVEKNLDVAKQVGRYTSLNRYYPFQLQNRRVIWDNKVCDGAYDERSGVLKVNFKHLGKDNPMINALILYKGTLEDTDYPRLAEIKKNYDEVYEKERLKKEFEEKYMQSISNAKLKQRRRNDLEIDFEEYENIYIEEELEKSGTWMYAALMVAAISAAVFVVMKTKASLQSTAKEKPEEAVKASGKKEQPGKQKPKKA